MSIESLKSEVARQFGTPAVVIDLDVVERNIARVQALCEAAGVANRPHIKTHKSPVIASMQRDAGARGITCQKIGEAEVMADGSHDDILIAYNILGEEKLGRIAEGLSYISTHPMSASRQKAFAASRDPRRAYRPALTPAQWQALRNVCANDPARRKDNSFNPFD